MTRTVDDLQHDTNDGLEDLELLAGHYGEKGRPAENDLDICVP